MPIDDPQPEDLAAFDSEETLDLPRARRENDDDAFAAFASEEEEVPAPPHTRVRPRMVFAALVFAGIVVGSWSLLRPSSAGEIIDAAENEVIRTTGVSAASVEPLAVSSVSAEVVVAAPPRAPALEEPPPMNDARRVEPIQSVTAALAVESLDQPASRVVPAAAPVDVPEPLAASVLSAVNSPTVSVPALQVAVTAAEASTAATLPVATPVATPQVAPPASDAAAAPPRGQVLASAPRVEPPPVPAAPDEQGAIRRVLEAYRDSYARLDAGSTVAVWPTVDERALDRAFATLYEQDVRFDRCDLRIAGARAQARCSGEVRFVPRVGDPAPRFRQLSWEFDLIRTADHWQIANVSAR